MAPGEARPPTSHVLGRSAPAGAPEVARPAGGAPEALWRPPPAPRPRWTTAKLAVESRSAQERVLPGPGRRVVPGARGPDQATGAAPRHRHRAETSWPPRTGAPGPTPTQEAERASPRRHRGPNPGPPRLRPAAQAAEPEARRRAGPQGTPAQAAGLGAGRRPGPRGQAVTAPGPGRGTAATAGGRPPGRSRAPASRAGARARGRERAPEGPPGRTAWAPRRPAELALVQAAQTAAGHTPGAAPPPAREAWRAPAGPTPGSPARAALGREREQGCEPRPGAPTPRRRATRPGWAGRRRRPAMRSGHRSVPSTTAGSGPGASWGRWEQPPGRRRSSAVRGTPRSGPPPEAGAGAAGRTCGASWGAASRPGGPTTRPAAGSATPVQESASWPPAGDARRGPPPSFLSCGVAARQGRSGTTSGRWAPQGRREAAGRPSARPSSAARWGGSGPHCSWALGVAGQLGEAAWGPGGPSSPAGGAPGSAADRRRRPPGCCGPPAGRPSSAGWRRWPCGARSPRAKAGAPSLGGRAP